MEKQNLNIFVRAESGKSGAKKLRKEGYIPSIVYGHNKPNILTKVSAKMLLYF